MPDLSPQLLAELDAAISQRHLDAVANEIRNNASECYAMVTVGEDDYSTVGNTRFGGDPDLPAGINWPVDPDKPETTYCNFIAQINFAELPPLSRKTGLPSQGILYLFVRDVFMEHRFAPVFLDGLYFDGSIDSLSRCPSPENEKLSNGEYLAHIVPQQIAAVPSVSLASYRKQFRQHIDDNTQVVDGKDGGLIITSLESNLQREGQIGQMLGFANAGDEHENLYRHVVLGRLGKRDLIYSDYWETMQEYEAYLERWQGYDFKLGFFEGMRDDVEWLIANREIISSAVDQWRLLFRIDSDLKMQLIFNDFDPLYVFIQEHDLARKNFSDLACELTYDELSQ